MLWTSVFRESSRCRVRDSTCVNGPWQRIEDGFIGSNTLACKGLTCLEVWERCVDRRGDIFDNLALGELDRGLNDSLNCDFC